jgi:hypothetical protein
LEKERIGSAANPLKQAYKKKKKNQNGSRKAEGNQ